MRRGRGWAILLLASGLVGAAWVCARGTSAPLVGSAAQPERGAVPSLSRGAGRVVDRSPPWDTDSLATRPGRDGVGPGDGGASDWTGASIAGQVRFSDGRPAPQARVTASEAVEHRARSDAAGAYALGVSPGTWRIGASLGEWVGAAQGPVSLGPGEDVSGVDVVLLQGGRLVGTVRRASPRQPLAGARISVSAHDVAGELADAVSDGDGRFLALPIPAGVVDVVVSAPGLADFVARGLLTRAPGETRLEADLLELGSVAGHVQGDDGRPISGVVVGVEGSPTPPAATDAHGDVSLPGVPPGPHRLALSRNGLPTVFHGLEVKPGAVMGATVTLETFTRRVSGTVLHADGARVGPGVSVGATPWRGGAAGQAATDEAGAWSLELTAGLWTIFVRMAGEWGAPQVQVNAEQPPPPLTLRLTRVSDLMHCLVLDVSGRPVPHAWLAAQAEHKVIVMETDDDGIAPIWLEAPGGRPRRISATSLGRLGVIELPAAATACTVQLQPAATVALHLRDAPSEPVFVSVPGGLPLATSGDTVLQFTARDAEFPFPAGTHRLGVSSGALRAAAEITASPGQRVDVAVTLAAPDGGE